MTNAIAGDNAVMIYDFYKDLPKIVPIQSLWSIISLYICNPSQRLVQKSSEWSSKESETAVKPWNCEEELKLCGLSLSTLHDEIVALFDIVCTASFTFPKSTLESLGILRIFYNSQCFKKLVIDMEGLGYDEICLCFMIGEEEKFTV